MKFVRNAKAVLSPLKPLIRSVRRYQLRSVQRYQLYRLIAANFDKAFYLQQYPELAGTGKDLVAHYITQGCYEEADPHPQFSTLQYLIDNEDVRVAGLNPYYHWLKFGKAERRHARPNLQTFHDIIINDFDKDVYLKAFPDVESAGIDPLEHYLTHGFKEERLTRSGIIVRAFYDNGFDPSFSEYDLIISEGEVRNFENFVPMEPGQEDREELICFGVVLYNNTQEQVVRLLKSIGTQQVKHRVSIIDNSPESLYELLSLDHQKTTYTHHPENLGFAIAHNQLMSQGFASGCDFYIGLNPDGFLMPDGVTNALNQWNSTTGLIDFQTLPLPHPKHFMLETGETAWCSGVCFMLSKRSFDVTGGFDPQFPMYGEDVDLSFRIRTAGLKCQTATRSFFFHDVCDRFYCKNPERDEKSLIGNWYLLKKWGAAERASVLEMKLAAMGSTLPEVLACQASPESDILSSIRDDLELERYAHSRFF